MKHPRVPIGEVTEIVSGATPDTGVPDYWGGDIWWATPKDLSALSRSTIARTARTITSKGLSSCAARVLPPGAVLFSSRAPIGHVAINLVPMATNQGFKSFIPKGGVLENRYLYHWLRANRPRLEAMGSGATFKELSKAAVERIELPLPPLAEQRRIADLLDAMDDLLRRSNATIELVRALRQAIVDEAVRGCRVESLGDLALEFRYGTSQKAGTSGVPVLRIPNVTGGEIDPCDLKRVELPDREIERYRLAKNDLLLVRSNGNPEFIGRCAVFEGSLHPPDEPWVFASYLIRVRLRGSVDAQVVSAYLQSQSGRAQLLAGCRTSAGQYNINTEALRALSIPVPSPQAQRKMRGLLRATSIQRDRLVQFRERLLSSQDSIRERVLKT